MIAPEIECRDCDGWGHIGSVDGEPVECIACSGEGWRPMTDDENDAAAEEQAERAVSEPPMSLGEQHAAAWDQKQELRR